MNIFVLNEDPKLAAIDHCDKHVLKMIIESAQMLCTAHHLTNSIIAENPEIPKLYKATHRNHPCSVWVRASIANYKWLALLAYELCNQYTERYHKVHKTQKLIEYLAVNYPMLPSLPLTPFAQAMPDQYRRDDAVVAYRTYYIESKFHFASWKNGDIPSWWPFR